MNQERRWALRQAALPVLAVCILATGPALATASTVTGQWDFASGLTATVGADLEYGDGPTGYTAANTQFGTASSFGLPGIQPITAGGALNGSPVNANVMMFPRMGTAEGEDTSGRGYKVWPGMAANGGGEYVNQYTLVADVYYPAASNGTYRPLFQTNDTNWNDADLWINPDNGLGVNGDYHGTINPDSWYRVAFVVDLTQPGGDLFKYINGQLVGVTDLHNWGEGDLEGRFALYTAEQGYPAWLFSDDNNETAMGYTAHVQLWDGALSGDEVAALGGIINTPEPATLALVALGGVALLRRRR